MPDLGGWDDYDPYLDDPERDREPDEPDFDAIAYAEHCDEAHGGRACDCPPAPPIEPGRPGDPDYAEEAPF